MFYMGVRLKACSDVTWHFLACYTATLSASMISFSRSSNFANLSITLSLSKTGGEVLFEQAYHKRAHGRQLQVERGRM